jgi:hypothetical protein
MNFVTLGHWAASLRASPVVTLRQLLSPNPSARASVIFLEPHHGGRPDEDADAAPVDAADEAAAVLEPAVELELELEPQAATAAAHDSPRAAVSRRLLLMCMNLSNPSCAS